MKWLLEWSPSQGLEGLIDVTTDFALYSQSLDLLYLESFRQMCSNTRQNRLGALPV